MFKLFFKQVRDLGSKKIRKKSYVCKTLQKIKIYSLKKEKVNKIYP